jgi:hypothetical protein
MAAARETCAMSDETITIRRAVQGDRRVLERLAGRDSTVLPDDEFLVAEVGDEAWAAIALRTGEIVADPFRPSAGVAELLRVRIEREGGEVTPADQSTPLLHRLAHRAVA